MLASHVRQKQAVLATLHKKYDEALGKALNGIRDDENGDVLSQNSSMSEMSEFPPLRKKLNQRHQLICVALPNIILKHSIVPFSPMQNY